MPSSASQARAACALILCALAIPAGGDAQTVPDLDPAQWREDLEYYAARMAEVHENLYHTISESDLNRAVSDLERRLPQLDDSQVIVELARITAMVGDGHTRLWLMPDGRNGFRQVPIFLYWLHDGLYVLGAPAADSVVVGGKVIRIGNVDAEDAWRRVAPLVSRDNEMTVRSIAPRYLEIPEVLHALGITDDADHVRYVVRDAASTEHSVTLDAIPDASLSHLSNMPYLATTAADRVRLAMADGGGEPPLWLRHPTRTFWFQWLPERQTLYVQINRIANASEETLAEFAERAYAEADRRQARHLVLDLRLNGGGNNMLNLPVVLGIVRRPELDRRGGVFVLIGRHTFSAASHLVTYLERLTNAVFVGEPTGGSPNHFGDASGVELPNSGLRIGASTIYWQNSEPKEFESRNWTPPDIAVDLTIGDYRAKRDPVLQAALDYVPQPPLPNLLAQALDEGGVERATEVYRAFRADPKNAYVSAEGEMNIMGYDFLDSGDAAKGVAIFEFNAEDNPQSANAFDSLGDGYVAVGDTARAIESYRHALELDPTFAASAANLRRLTSGS